MSKLDELIKYFDGTQTPYDGLVVAVAELQKPAKVTIGPAIVKALDVDAGEVVWFRCSPCPRCGKWVAKSNFCQHCGQALDWGDCGS